MKSYPADILENLVQWNCRDECKYRLGILLLTCFWIDLEIIWKTFFYRCMHKTTQVFIDQGFKIPQFHGKWPFVRFLSLQEPASVFFSLLNIFIHYKGLTTFRQMVQSDSPNYRLWHAFAMISLNAWAWSAIFHARDFHLSELLDYIFAYSMVLASFWCMLIR